MAGVINWTADQLNILLKALDYFGWIECRIITSDSDWTIANGLGEIEYKGEKFKDIMLIEIDTK